MSITGKFINQFTLSTTTTTGDEYLFQRGSKYYKIPKENLFSEIITAVGALTSGWLLTGNAGTNPSTQFIGTTDARDFILRTNNTRRAWFLDNGNITIGANANSNSAPFHLKSTGTLVQVNASSTTGISLTDNFVVDNSTTAAIASFGFQTSDTGKTEILHRRASQLSGAKITLGGTVADGNIDGFSISTGNSSNVSGYKMHIDNSGKVFFTTGGLLSSFSGTKAKVNIVTEGNGAATIGFQIKNTDNRYTLRVWDNQRIVTNRPDVYSPVAALDFYTPLLTGSIFKKMESAAGVLWEQLCNGDVVMGRGISTGSKLGIKGDGNAFVGQPTHSLHVKGNVRFDGQTSNTAGALTGSYLIINVDNVDRKIALYAAS